MEEAPEAASGEFVGHSRLFKLLNFDDSLELFEVTLPSPTLLQVRKNRRGVARQARALLSLSPGSARVNLLTMALSGKSVDFTKVISMIEQEDVFVDSIDRLEDEEKSLATDIEGHKRVSSDFTEQLSGTEERLDNVTKSVAELDAGVAKSTKIRQHEHSEFVAVTANNAATSKLLGLAVNPSVQVLCACTAQTAPKAELSGEESASRADKSRSLRDSMIPKRLFSQG